ncbi:hypothetical protein OIO90_003740 [Microbotryomycetes sp. JL221]|nr:hypothetical protein OIO90_003740 [Microbotryomycetes sp. JL221]
MRLKCSLGALAVTACVVTVISAMPSPATNELGVAVKPELGLAESSHNLHKRHGGEDDDDDMDGHAMHDSSHEEHHGDAHTHNAVNQSSSVAESGPTSNEAGDHSHTSHSHAGKQGAGHGHYHGKAHEHYNETLVLMTHEPDPLAYWRFDQTADGHRSLLFVHIAAMTFSFFVLLPLSIFLRVGKSGLSTLPQVLFLGMTTVGALLGRAYNAMTPSLYESSSHSRLGWFVMIFAFALNTLDVARVLVSSSGSLRSRIFGSSNTSGTGSWHIGKLVSTPRSSNNDEAHPLVFEAEQFEATSPVEVADASDDHHWRNVSLGADRARARPIRNSSQTSSDAEGTLYDSAGPEGKQASHPDHKQQAQVKGWRKAAMITFRVMEVILVVLGYVETLSGIAVYSGSCRGAYINGCMAHTIKGSVFVFYGLLTWGRYLGAFADLGWAWNKRPGGSRGVWTAEFVECFVCFFYGITNTWLERLGKHAGDPYSAKDVQHISIAVMFWFAGILGMMLESKKFRQWLQTPVYAVSSVDRSRISPPASASFSFNPFPSIIIGTTGVAMSAHAQLFKFQVDVHALWGLFLGLFGVFRCLTYFFLFLRPPASVLPSRPPTEALASMFLTCGGVVFILSTEQVTLAAMRHQFDDIMMFLNGTVSLVSIAFCWLMALFAIKGWALDRTLSSREMLAKSAFQA